MTSFDPGAIVLVRFPFTDLSSDKKRPALVVSPADYRARFGDIVVLALTSQPGNADETLIRKWKDAGLPKPTWIRPVIATLASAMVNKQLGMLAQDDAEAVRVALRGLIDQRYCVGA